MAFSPSPLSRSPRESLPPIPIQDAKASNVDKTAKKRFCLPPSTPSASLILAEQERESLLKNYLEAQRLTERNPEEARDLALTLINKLRRTNSNFLVLAACKLDLALTYPQDDDRRTQAILDAKKDIDQAYEERNLYFYFKTEEKIILYYKNLRTSLQKLKLLVPIEMKNLHADIAFKLEKCSSQIPLLTDFYDKISQGVLLEAEPARELYLQALLMITDHEEPEYLLAQAFGITNLALTYDAGNDNPWFLKAHSRTLKAYERKQELFTTDQAKLTALNHFKKIFKSLSQLFLADSTFQIQIKEKLAECRKEIARTGQALEDKVPSPTNSPRVTPKVTKEPVDSWKAARLFIAFGFATVVIVGAFVLGRRYITQLNFSK